VFDFADLFEALAEEDDADGFADEAGDEDGEGRMKSRMMMTVKRGGCS